MPKPSTNQPSTSLSLENLTSGRLELELVEVDLKLDKMDAGKSKLEQQTDPEVRGERQTVGESSQSTVASSAATTAEAQREDLIRFADSIAKSAVDEAVDEYNEAAAGSSDSSSSSDDREARLASLRLMDSPTPTNSDEDS